MMRKRILVVDDSAHATQLIERLLGGTGAYDVLAENNAKAAIQTARAFRPDLIILDVVMPEMDGPEIALALRGDEQLKDIPVVLLTSLISKDEPAAPDKLFSGFSLLGKPPRLEELVAYIEARTGNVTPAGVIKDAD